MLEAVRVVGGTLSIVSTARVQRTRSTRRDCSEHTDTTLTIYTAALVGDVAQWQNVGL